MNEDYHHFMKVALDTARVGFHEGGVPVGAALVCDGQMLGVGHNRRIQEGSPILHGEIDALRNAGRLPASVYRKSILYTTLSPCAMCSGAVLLYCIPHVVIGENRTFVGEEDLLRERGVRVDVLDDHDCRAVMKEFIERYPEVWNEDIGA